MTIVFHIDVNKKNEISSKETGPLKAIQAAKILRGQRVSIQLFPWSDYIKNTTTKPQQIRDLADSVEQAMVNQDCNLEHLKEVFQRFLTFKGV